VRCCDQKVIGFLGVAKLPLAAVLMFLPPTPLVHARREDLGQNPRRESAPCAPPIPVCQSLFAACQAEGRARPDGQHQLLRERHSALIARDFTREQRRPFTIRRRDRGDEGRAAPLHLDARQVYEHADGDGRNARLPYMAGANLRDSRYAPSTTCHL
jgi:hypothetical protein